jgi:hypothetical protein
MTVKLQDLKALIQISIQKSPYSCRYVYIYINVFFSAHYKISCILRVSKIIGAFIYQYAICSDLQTCESWPLRFQTGNFVFGYAIYMNLTNVNIGSLVLWNHNQSFIL